jgi:hypothetical protein
MWKTREKIRAEGTMSKGSRSCFHTVSLSLTAVIAAIGKARKNAKKSIVMYVPG